MNSIRYMPDQTTGLSGNPNVEADHHAEQLVNFITRWVKYADNPLPPPAYVGVRMHVDDLIKSIEKAHPPRSKEPTTYRGKLHKAMEALETAVNVRTATLLCVPGIRSQHAMMLVKHEYFQYLAFNCQDYLPLARELHALARVHKEDTGSRCMFTDFMEEYRRYPKTVTAAIYEAIVATLKCRDDGDLKKKDAAVTRAVAMALTCNTSELPIRELVPAYVAFVACGTICLGVHLPHNHVEECITAAIHALYEIHIAESNETVKE